MEIRAIAHIKNSYTAKFGIPRQSGIVDTLLSEIVPEPQFSSYDAFKGIEGFSHLWLIWDFSESRRDNVSLTVRPPRLGGNERVGVFASRSPFRPNSLGLSCVRLVSVNRGDSGVTLTVAGADLMNGTPIYDIKPYLPYADSIADAVGGFAAERPVCLEVEADPGLLAGLSKNDADALLAILSQDPRPSYQDDPSRVYGMSFASREVKFRVEGGRVYLLDVE